MHSAPRSDRLFFSLFTFPLTFPFTVILLTRTIDQTKEIAVNSNSFWLSSCEDTWTTYNLKVGAVYKIYVNFVIYIWTQKKCLLLSIIMASLREFDWYSHNKQTTYINHFTNIYYASNNMRNCSRRQNVVGKFELWFKYWRENEIQLLRKWIYFKIKRRL